MTRILISLFAFLLLSASPATAAAHPPVIMGNGPSLHPEGVTYDPVRHRFLVGSVTHGTVSRVAPDGKAHTLVDDQWLITTMGLAVDPHRGRVLVTNADLGRADRSKPETTRAFAGLGVYDLRTGKPIHRVTLATGPGHFANDVALAPDGTAYVTDSISGTVYRVTPDGTATTLVQHPDLAQPTTGGWGLNGIVHLGDKLVAALSGARKLAVIPLGDPHHVTTISAPIGAPDGLLALDRNRILLVDNTAANRVVEVRTKDRWQTVEIVREVKWPDKAPTTLTKTPCGAYAVAGRLDVLLAGGRSDEFVLRRV
jgi:sugar lactone lactonase YvrE